MKKTRLLLPSTALAIAVVAACGGGTAPVDGAGSVVLSTYVTDNLARHYKQVWVQVLKITAFGPAGQAVVLYEPSADEASNPVNVSQLASVGQLMSQVAVPAGSFRHVSITLGDRVTLVPRDGSRTIQATLGGGGAPVTVELGVDMNASSPTALVLDFDLSRFTYDPATNRVALTVARRDARDLGRLLRQQAELRGTVVSVGTDRVVVDDRHLGAGVTVQLVADAVVLDEHDRAVVDLAALKAGTRIAARVVVQPRVKPGDATVVQAALVRIEPADEPVARRLQGAGTVIALERAQMPGAPATAVTVDLNEANFMPTSGSAVIDVSRAVFSHGTVGELAVGQRIGFRGRGSPGGLRASHVAIEGAASPRSRDQRPNDRFVEGAGVIESVSGSVARVTVGDRSPWLLPGTYTVDASRALFEAGRPECLRPGAAVAAKGLLDGSGSPPRTLVARVVRIEGGCARR